MNRNTMHAILAEPGKEPEILMLPTDGLQHEEALRDVPPEKRCTCPREADR